MIFQRLENMIASDEGFESRPYRDTLGFWTYGYGSRVDLTGKEVQKLTAPISEPQARQLLRGRIYQACLDAQTYLPELLTLLTPQRAELIVGMAYQLGGSGLSKFVHFRERLRLRDWHGAAEHMRNSLWGKQTPNRVERMAKLMEAA